MKTCPVDCAQWLSRDPLSMAEMKAGPNLYDYVGNDPVDLNDPLGLFGVVGGVTASTEGGVGPAASAGATGAAGGGMFVNSDSGNVSGGEFADGGAFANWGSHKASAPSAPDMNNGAAGFFAGGGLMVGLTNANCISDLDGPFKTYSGNIGWFLKALGIQVSYGHNSAGKPIYVATYSGPMGFPSGAGWGGDASQYNTYTVTH